jgi:hypothetical protein
MSFGPHQRQRWRTVRCSTCASCVKYVVAAFNTGILIQFPLIWKREIHAQFGVPGVQLGRRPKKWVSNGRPHSGPGPCSDEELPKPIRATHKYAFPELALEPQKNRPRKSRSTIKFEARNVFYLSLFRG